MARNRKKKKPSKIANAPLGRVIAIENQKGGVGKTTTTLNLAAALAESGRKVLIYDVDWSKSGLTKYLHIPRDYYGALEVITGGCEAFDAVITGEEEDINLPSPNIHLIPAIELSSLADWLKPLPKEREGGLLVESVNTLRSEYDYILIDTPPSESPTLIAALGAADYVLVSVFPEEGAVNGLWAAIDQIAEARGQRPELALIGIVVGKIPNNPRTIIAKSILEEVDRNFRHDGKSLRLPEVRQSEDIRKAETYRTSVIAFDPQCSVANDYRLVAEELEARLGAVQPEQVVVHG